ncbi:MAG: molybdate ABC transporter substrate-binding protein [Lachnospiraceae bacterium]|nr:molybdate ABC transporter substrate-binding protein [Lachnospiraceae bacterium]
MKKNTKRIIAAGLTLAGVLALCACGSKKEETTEKAKETEAVKETTADTEAKETEAAKDTETAGSSGESKEIVVLAAASLKDVCGELETMYEAKVPGIDLVFSFAGSGALQTQIEEGAPADLFISAGKKQVNALKDENLMKEDTICDLLENKVVLIVPSDSALGLTSFEDVKKDEVKMIGIGELESVPAGQYAQKVFTSLGFWDDVDKKANYGTDVRTVLSWVEAGEVDCGVVYATDAYTSDKVKIVAEAPEGSCDRVIYPAGVVAASKNPDEATAFLDYLKSDEAVKVFEKYGFLMGE